MIEQIPLRLTLFFILYGGTAAVPIVLCLYLLLRKGNAIAADTTPPMPLRRWAAALFGVLALSHVWWLLLYVFSNDIHTKGYVMACIFDCVGMLTTIAGTLLSMLQDRRRPLWPFIAAMVPIVILGGLQMVWPGTVFKAIFLDYILVVYLLLTIYMMVAVRQYGRWLNDNYADLENKKVWLSLVVTLGCLLLFILYIFDVDNVRIYLLHIVELLLSGLLLWRVETLPQLEGVEKQQEDSLPVVEPAQEPELPAQTSVTLPSNIEQLLAENCADTRLYLQHDLTLAQLSAVIGVNRYYLSQYFSVHGMNYNTYINGLRISHFISRYHEAVANQESFTAQQLAQESGYRSYSTFSNAFKQRMGQSAKAWMNETAVDTP